MKRSRTFVVTAPTTLKGREFKASIPVRAARKAFTALCKNYPDRMEEMIMIQESTPFRKQREYCYEFKREKIEKSLTVDVMTPFEITFKTTVRSVCDNVK